MKQQRRRPARESLIVNKNTRKINNKSYQMIGVGAHGGRLARRNGPSNERNNASA